MDKQDKGDKLPEQLKELHAIWKGAMEGNTRGEDWGDTSQINQDVECSRCFWNEEAITAEKKKERLQGAFKFWSTQIILI